jgi:cyclohexanecarboxyl-CoA dehydrogenase
VTLGNYSDTAIVFARTSDDGAHGVSAFYVDLNDQPVTRAPFRDLGSHAIGRASLYFDGMFVPADRLIGGLGRGFTQVMHGFDYARALISMLCVGAAQQSIDEATEYARGRQAFGQPIGRFQGVAFPLVSFQTQLKAARLLALEALWRKDQGLPHTAEANMVKAWAPRLAFDAIHQALLLHGHTGFAEELPLSQRLRDVVGLEIGDGTAQVASLVVARQLLGRAYAP